MRQYAESYKNGAPARLAREVGAAYGVAGALPTNGIISTLAAAAGLYFSDLGNTMNGTEDSWIDFTKDLIRDANYELVARKEIPTALGYNWDGDPANDAIGADISDGIAGYRHFYDDLPRDGLFFHQMPTPLVIDMDGDGVELTNIDGSFAYFDLNSDGFAENTGWVSSDDAFLAIDSNGNGLIDGKDELFGDSPGYADGFAKLSTLDTNFDGVINSTDSSCSDLLLWRDTNSDGATDSGELISAETAGISSIDLSATSENYTNEGNQVILSSTVNWGDGSTTAIEDIRFETDPVDSGYVLPDSFEFDSQALMLRFLKGSGTLKSTWIALSEDAALRTQSLGLIALLDSGDVAQFRTEFESFVLNWAGVSAIDPQSRGAHVDARHLAVLEKLYGQEFSENGLSANPNAATGPGLEELYETLIDKYAGRYLAHSATSSELLGNIVAAENHPLAGLRSLRQNSQRLEGDFFEVLGTIRGLAITQVLTTSDAQALANIVKHDLSAGEHTTLGVEISDVLGSIQVTLSGTEGDDTYIFREGDGGFTISDEDFRPSQNDILVFSDTMSTEITVSRSGADAKLTHTSGETVTIENHFGSNYHQIEVVEFSDGVSYDSAALHARYVQDAQAAGDQVIYGTTNDDVFEHASGDGSYTINDEAYSSGQNDRLVFTDVSSSTVVISRTGDDAVLTLGNGEVITLYKQFSSEYFGVESVEFSDGVSYDQVELESLSSGVSTSDPTPTIVGTEAGETLRGEGEADVIAGLGGDDLLTGGDNDDVLLGGDGADTLKGNAGDDDLRGGDGDDELEGNQDNDTLWGGVGNDLLWGGPGADGFRFGAGDGADIVKDFNPGDDKLVLTGTSFVSAAAALAAFVDTAEGAFLDLGNGDTLLLEGDLVSSLSEANIELSSGETTGEGGSTGGGSTSDPTPTIVGTEAGETLRGEGEADVIAGLGGDDLLTGGDNDDVLFGGDGADTLKGNAGDDDLRGGDGDDELEGNQESDLLFGGDGSDTLDGGPGVDLLVGGSGDDVLIGGGGADWFVTGAGHGSDTISDFSASSADKMLLLDTGFATSADALAAFTDVNGDAQLQISASETLTLSGVATASLSEADILTMASNLVQQTAAAGGYDASLTSLVNRIEGQAANEVTLGAGSA